MSFAAMVGENTCVLAHAYSPIHEAIEALGALGQPGGGSVAVDVRPNVGLSLVSNALLQPLGPLARRRALVDQKEKLLYLRHFMREGRRRSAVPG